MSLPPRRASGPAPGVGKASLEPNRCRGDSAIITRTTQQTATFRHPFTISGVDGIFPAGCYVVRIEEEAMVGLSFIAYRRIETAMLVPLRRGSSNSVQAVSIDPRDLAASLARDRTADLTGAGA